jgi:gliding motility-associated-like protein
MKYLALIIFTLLLFIISCTEKEENYPVNENIFLKVTGDTTLVIKENQTYFLNAETGNPNDRFFWHMPNLISKAEITVNYPGTFIVDIINDSGCTDTAIDTIIVIDISTMYYPNSFSPNDDEMNDKWSPRGENFSIDDYFFKVYDKKDHLLYTAEKINDAWDGKIDGEVCPIGYYYYVAKYTTLDGQNHKDHGIIQLMH